MNAWLDANLNPQIAAVWLDALLKSFVVLAFAAGLCLAWRRAAAATRHLIWFFGVVGLLMLPMLPFVLPTTTRPLWTVSGGQLSGNEMALSLELGPVKPSPAIAESVPGEHPLVQGAPASGRQLFKAHVSRNWGCAGFWRVGIRRVARFALSGCGADSTFANGEKCRSAGDVRMDSAARRSLGNGRASSSRGAPAIARERDAAHLGMALAEGVDAGGSGTMAGGAAADCFAA